MTRHLLGIDIGDGQVAGVLLARQGRTLQLTGCCRMALAADADTATLVEAIREVAGRTGWQRGTATLGLPLAHLFVRNLTLPFTSSRSITQTLPFELEEQLIVPVDTLVTDFVPIGSTAEGGSQVIACAAEQGLLAELLAGLGTGLDPEVVTPATLALAARVARDNPPGRQQLLAHLEGAAAVLMLIDGPRTLLCRRLPCAEPLLQGPAGAVDTLAGETVNDEAVRMLAVAVERTVDLHRLESGEPFQPGGLVLTGPLAAIDGVRAVLTAALGLPAQPVDLAAAAGVTVAVPDDEWGGGRHYDAALALALLGPEKRPGINFRRGPFARPRSLFSSRQRLVAAAVAALAAAGLLGLLWSDLHRLQQRDRAIREEMTAIYRQTFPAATTVREPYAEMQAAMRGVQGPAAPLPSAGSGQRVLELLADISGRIPPSVAVQVSRLSIDRETVLVKGTTDTYNAVETIKSGLSASPRFSGVKIVSATADKDKDRQGGQIRFELELQLKGG